MPTLKIGRFYEDPVVEVIIIIFGIFLYLDNYYRNAGALFAFMGLLSLILSQIYESGGYLNLKVNSKKGNTLKSMIAGIIGLVIVVGISLVYGFTLGGWTGASLVNFWEYSRGAVLGSGESPFAGNPLFEIMIFGVFIVIAETIIAAKMFNLLLIIFKARLDYKDLRAWACAGIIGVASVFYHIYAKTVAAGKPNTNILVVMGVIFFVQMALIIYTKEVESAIWLHMINNLIALSAFSVILPFLTNWMFIAIVVGIIIVINMKDVKSLLIRWRVMQ